MNFRSLRLMIAEILTLPLVYPLYFSVIFIKYFKFSSIFKQQKSRTIHLSYHMFIEHYHNKHLISISAV